MICRYIVIAAVLGDVKARVYAAVDDPLRDDKRSANLTDAIVRGDFACKLQLQCDHVLQQYYKEYLDKCVALEFPFADAEVIYCWLSILFQCARQVLESAVKMQPGDRRTREQKVCM